MEEQELDQLGVNTIRMLALDAINKANSGHPGLPLGAAPMAYVLWKRFMHYNPREPQWFNRDRFVLSAGHGSAMLYALLHLCGYPLSLDELKNFRQWGSETPGHPEYGVTAGVEATTGPLGQGFAMGLGMAIAEAFLAARFNRADFPIVNHYTYGIVSDGDLMEGVAAEAASLAGHLRLGRLIYLYDSNDISIEGSTELAFSEDVAQRFRAYRWEVIKVDDGNDLDAIADAISQAQKSVDKPTLIEIKTHIGYGSPKQDTAAVHGSPLGGEALAKTKQNLAWPQSPTFYIPAEVKDDFSRRAQLGQSQQAAWDTMLESYHQKQPQLAREFDLLLQGKLPENWDSELPEFPTSPKGMATRVACGKILNALATKLPTLMGGSADLAPSTKTLISEGGDFSGQNPIGRNLRFGIREHAMGAVVNGMALHGGVLPYGATFLVFSDYMRPSLRLSALMGCRSIFIFTHDSIGLGEDGPTHQPVEHLMSLRAIPGLKVIRPADANETKEAWRMALLAQGPSVLALTRQNLPELSLDDYPVTEARYGGYILAKAQKPEVILVATGSEVHLALKAREELQKRGVMANVVSMLCVEVFFEQPEEYRQRVLPPEIPRLAIEAGITQGWGDYLQKNLAIGINRFGASAPWETLYQKFAITVENTVAKALSLL